MLKEQALKSLRDEIARLISTLETWNTLHDVRDGLKLPSLDVPENPYSKQSYLQSVTKAASEQTIVIAAQQIITSYPGSREQPSASDIQFIQDSLWWIESDGIQHISNVCRYNIAETLEGIRFWGRLTPRDAFSDALPAIYNVPESSDDGYMYERLYKASIDSNPLDAFFSSNFSGASDNWVSNRILLSEYLQKHGFTEWPDQRFILLVERLIHPELQPDRNQKLLVERLEPLLKHDGFELRAEDSQGGLPIYKVRKRGAGVSGTPKYIIFASKSKPDIVIEDALNADIRVVSPDGQCLIYDQPPREGDISWLMLVEWWANKFDLDSRSEEVRNELGNRLVETLASKAEKVFFSLYFREFKNRLEDRLPALLPQVCLHYDPRNRNQRNEPIFMRQRMDFLMLLRNSVRIIIEIDGIHHYSSPSPSGGVSLASPKLYAEMVAEDRRIKNLGYEVYRFGGAELVTYDGQKFIACDGARETVVSFFNELFARYEIR